MNVSFLPFFGKKEKPQYFLALLLRDEKVSAVVFEELLGKIQVLGKHEEYFEDSIEEASEEEWLEVLDKAISTAESVLPKNLETQKTVFGVKETWVLDSKIKKEYLLKLKKASEALGLSPIGFLVIHEAIAHLMQQEEGAPVSAILLEVDKKNLAVSVLKAGKIIETKRARIEDKVSKTCDDLLHYFKDCEILPSRVVIFDGRDADVLQQEFIGHSWSKNLPFLHVPQITILPKGFDAQAVLFGAATQMGFEVLGEEEIVVKENERPIITETQKRAETQEFSASDNFSDSVVAGFGFLKNEDVALFSEKQEEPQKEQPEPPEEIETLKPEKPQAKLEPPQKKGEIFFSVINKIFLLLGAATVFGQFIFKTLKNIPLPTLPSLGGKRFIFFPFFVVVLIVISLLFYISFVGATIALNIKPKIVEQTKDLTFSTTSPTDPAKNLINAEVVSVSKDGESTADVVGKKEVGTPSKGTVAIYSRLVQGKTFNAQTVITALQTNLQFTLDKTVTVASASADASAAPSTVSVTVTAKDIGKEGNLPSGAKFSLASFDTADVVAKNDSAFSGGTKKEVTAVSKEDQNKLLAQLSKSLEQDAKNSLLEKVKDDKKVLPVFIATDFTKKDFNRKIGDEATKLTLKGTVLFQGVVYKGDDLDRYSKNLLAQNLKDLNLSKDGVQYDIKELKVKDNKEILAKITFRAYLLPKIDNQKLSGQLSGKSFEEAQKILLGLPQVEKVNITLRPKLPLLPKTLPRRASNIKIVQASHN